MKASWTTRSATASSDQVYLPRSGTIPSRTLTLNLNGTTFQGLRQVGGADLVNGRDYTVSGSTLTLTVIRDGQSRQVEVGTRQSGGRPVMGVQIQEQYKFPFEVKISVGDIGGPSAGMMFSLGIIDKLTKLDLTAGRFIAGTGEITARGQVQPIGGIQQKMVGARNAGATIFLTPASNCADTKGAVPKGLRLVKVSTLNQAVTYLEALKSGHPDSVPSC